MRGRPANPFLDLLAQAASKLAVKAVEGAADAVLEEVQEALTGANEKIGTARKKAKARGAAKRSPQNDVEIIDAEVIDGDAERH